MPLYLRIITIVIGLNLLNYINYLIENDYSYSYYCDTNSSIINGFTRVVNAIIILILAVVIVVLIIDWIINGNSNITWDMVKIFMKQ